MYLMWTRLWQIHICTNTHTNARINIGSNAYMDVQAQVHRIALLGLLVFLLLLLLLSLLLLLLMLHLLTPATRITNQKGKANTRKYWYTSILPTNSLRAYIHTYIRWCICSHRQTTTSKSEEKEEVEEGESIHKKEPKNRRDIGKYKRYTTTYSHTQHTEVQDSTHTPTIKSEKKKKTL